MSDVRKRGPDGNFEDAPKSVGQTVTWTSTTAYPVEIDRRLVALEQAVKGLMLEVAELKEAAKA